jgi:nucleotide-binding universal stress UspA family protein
VPQIKRVLFPVDFSPACFGAARYVEALAGRFEAEVMLLHVVVPGAHSRAEDLLAPRRDQLTAFASGDLRYFSTRVECLTGNDPASDIQSAAKGWKADLIMIPSHGLGTFRRLMLGSVAAKVLHDAECPVWTSVHAEQAPILENIHCRKVLCAVDLSPRSRSIISWAAWFAKEHGAALALAHAVAPWPSVYGEGLEVAFGETITREARNRVSALACEAGVEGEVFTIPGQPGQTIAETARKFGADILVTGRHSGTGISQYVGQHAYSIIRDSPCPVISI